MAELSNKYNITIEDLTAYCDFTSLLQLSADDACDAGADELREAQAELIDILMQDVIDQVENRLRHNYEIPFVSPLNKSLKGIICRLTVVALFKRRHLLPDTVAAEETRSYELLASIVAGETEIYGLTRTRGHMDSKRR